MNTFKKFFVVLAILVLSANAGLDLARYSRKHSVIAKAQTLASEQFDQEGMGGLKPRINDCFQIRDIGWACDFSVLQEGKEAARGVHVFTTEDLSK